MCNETKFSVNPRVADICHCRPSQHETILVGDTSLLCGFLERGRTQMSTTKPRMATNTFHSLLLVCLANKTLASNHGIFRERCRLHSSLEMCCDRMSWEGVDGLMTLCLDRGLSVFMGCPASPFLFSKTRLSVFSYLCNVPLV